MHVCVKNAYVREPVSVTVSVNACQSQGCWGHSEWEIQALHEKWSFIPPCFFKAGQCGHAGSLGHHGARTGQGPCAPGRDSHRTQCLCPGYEGPLQNCRWPASQDRWPGKGTQQGLRIQARTGTDSKPTIQTGPRSQVQPHSAQGNLTGIFCWFFLGVFPLSCESC